MAPARRIQSFPHRPARLCWARRRRGSGIHASTTWLASAASAAATVVAGGSPLRLALVTASKPPNSPAPRASPDNPGRETLESARRAQHEGQRPGPIDGRQRPRRREKTAPAAATAADPRPATAGACRPAGPWSRRSVRPRPPAANLPPSPYTVSSARSPAGPAAKRGRRGERRTVRTAGIKV
jgi:hypothetical protein